MSAATKREGARRSLSVLLFCALMLGLTGLFLVLGAWQWQRLGEKEALIATVESRMTLPPVPLPPAAAWPELDPAELDYSRVVVSGTYIPEATVLVFTSLGAPRGDNGGPGYWVMTPLALEGGGTLFVNRGFVPQAEAPAYADGGPLPPGPVSLTGIARVSERANLFTPPPDVENRGDWLRNTERLAALAGPGLEPVAPLYVDLPAGPDGILPQGGETVFEFPNNHLGYAFTWFGFGLLTPVLLGFWLFRQRRRAR